MQCPLLFRFRVVDRLPEVPCYPAVDLWFGNGDLADSGAELPDAKVIDLPTGGDAAS